MLFALAGCFAAIAQSKQEPRYDADLAKKLGADEYGMKSYVMVFLKAGPTPAKDSTSRAQLQDAHLKNIIKLADEGKLLIAGPFLDGKEMRGVFVLNVSTLEEAKKLTETDPAVKAGSLVMELHPWYGSAALAEVNELHKKVQKKSFVN
jgi:uncharacterized protein